MRNAPGVPRHRRQVKQPARQPRPLLCSRLAPASLQPLQPWLQPLQQPYGRHAVGWAGLPAVKFICARLALRAGRVPGSALPPNTPRYSFSFFSFFLRCRHRAPFVGAFRPYSFPRLSALAGGKWRPCELLLPLRIAPVRGNPRHQTGGWSGASSPQRGAWRRWRCEHRGRPRAAAPRSPGSRHSVAARGRPGTKSPFPVAVSVPPPLPQGR